jgi:hypothetical protein
MALLWQKGMCCFIGLRNAWDLAEKRIALRNDSHENTHLDKFLYHYEEKSIDF